MFGGRKPPQPNQPNAGTPPNPSSSAAPQVPSAPQGPRQPVGFESVLGANTTLKGDLKSQNANVRLDGTFEGSIMIDGNLMIGETARISADIHGKNITIAGAVRGNVIGQRIMLQHTGRVWGDLSAASITTEEGAFIDGKVTMMGHPAAKGFEQHDHQALPAPDVSILHPTGEDATSGEPVEVEMVEDQPAPSELT